MMRFLRKYLIFLVVVGALLFSLPGFAVPVSAQDVYTLDIVSPADGSVVSSPDFNLVISWTKPSSQWAAEVNVKIKLVTADSGSADISPWYNEVLEIGSPSYNQDSVTFTWNQYFASGWSSLGKPPAGRYSIDATLKHFGDVFVTAHTSFNYKPPSLISFFNVSPNRIKAGGSFTLSWKVNDDAIVSISNDIGDVKPESSLEITPTDVEDPEPGKEYMIEITLTAEGQTILSEEQASVIVFIEPLTFDEIFADYQAWGSNSHTWADGSSDAKPLIGPTSTGVRTNLLGGVTGTVGYTGFTRYGCQAMQYKTLVCLNEMKKAGKLIGWNYMPVRKIYSGTESIDYFQHNAVSISEVGTDWLKGYVLDPHPRQTPAYFRAGSSWRNDWSDLVTAYGRVYPGLPGGSAGANGKYNLGNFEDSVLDYFHAYTPWGTRVTKIDISIPSLEDDKPILITVDCPADLLITNSLGKRLGRLSDGTMVSEFIPTDAYFDEDENGDKQWYFSLPLDKYELTVTGTDSGTFNLYTYTGGDNFNEYENSPISSGQKATISLESGKIDELTQADGTKLKPVTEPITKFMPDFTPTPTTHPAPSPTEKTTAVVTTPKTDPVNNSFVWVYIVAAGVVLLTILIVVLKFGRKKTK